MADIKLNSTEWCDFIFEKKNKSYGAYKLRQSSSKRHVWAIGLTIVFAAVVVTIPVIASAIQEYARSNAAANIDEVFEMSKLDIEEQVPEENIIKQETAPPPPPLKSTVRFVPPIIAADEDVADDVEVHTQDDLLSRTEQISMADVIGDDDELGIDIAELQQQKVIVEAEPEIYEFVEQKPSFPGGEVEMMKFINNAIKYPVVAQEAGIQGRVMVQFVVTPTGSIEQVTVLQSRDPNLDKEALRVVRSMPKWTPGRQNGKAVHVYFRIPVTYRLQ